MQALCYDRFGPAHEVLELRALPRPDPGPGEVLVRLRYSGVNPSDVKARAGTRPGVTKPPYPVIVPHSDGAGVIEAVGRGVDTGRLGERVWIWNGQWQRAMGTAAEWIALPAAQAVPLPEGVPLEAGACLGIPGLTAAQTVLGGGDIAGRRVLVSGGGGAVGHNAVQLARWAGAEVIATCSPSDVARVRDAGAQHVFDYRDPDLAEKIRAVGEVHRAVEVELGRNAALLGEVMAPLGTIAVYGSAADMAPRLPFGQMLFKALKIDISLIYILPDAERSAMIDRLHEALRSGGLRPAVHGVVPLAEAAEAHRIVEEGRRAGAMLVDLGEVGAA